MKPRASRSRYRSPREWSWQHCADARHGSPEDRPAHVPRTLPSGKNTKASARLCIGFGCLLALTAAGRADLVWGVNGHPFTAYPGISFDEQLDHVKDLGLRSYRVNISHLDRIPELAVLVEKARARGIDILPVITPPLDLDRETPGDLYAQAYKMAVTLVSRFKHDIRVWELGNEMENYAIITACEMLDDGSQYDCSWGPAGGDAPSHYFTPRWKKASAVLRGLSDGTASVDPTIRRAMGTAGWGHTGAFERMLEDGIDWEISVWHYYGDDPLWAFEYLKSLEKPIWVTEFNYSSEKGEARQADELAKMIAVLRGHGNDYRIEAAHIYQLFDEPYWAPSFEAVMGLVRLEKAGEQTWKPAGPKLAYNVVKEHVARDPDAGVVSLPPEAPNVPAATDKGGDCSVGSLDTSVVNRANQVAYSYCLGLHRMPTPDEQWHHVSEMKQGLPPVDLVAMLIDASEATSTRSVDNSQYVAALYRKLLGREPDGHGLSTYVGRLEKHEMTRNDLHRELTYSLEFRLAHPFLFTEIVDPH